jgi:Zn-dependent protease with chaperone function
LSVVALSVVFLCLPIAVVAWGFRRAAQADRWTERARWVHVARTASQSSTLLLPLIAVAAPLVFVGPVSAIPSTLVTVVLALVGVLAGALVAARVANRIHDTQAPFLQSVAGLAMAYLPILALLGLGWFAPSSLASWWMLPWIASALVVVRAWLRMPLLMLRTPLAFPADDRLRDLVDRVARVVGTEVDQVLELRARQPNAFAFPWLGAVAFSSGILELLDDEELEAITHHELAHMSESSGMTRLRQAQLYAFVPLAATRPLFGAFGIAGVISAVALLMAVIEFTRRKALAAEHASDHAALEAIHHSKALGQALEKTYRVGLIPAVLKRASHGPLHERLAVAGVEADFDVPAPPPSAPVLLATAAAVVAFAVLMFSPWITFRLVGSESETPTQLAAALPIYGVDPLLTLASDAELKERWRDAAVLYEAAARVSADDSYLHGETIRLWAFAGDCVRARESADSQAPPSIEVGAYYEDLIDWCILTGGIEATG